MNIAGLNLELHSLHEPKGRADLIMLLEEACAEMKRVNALLAKIIVNGKLPAEV